MMSYVARRKRLLCREKRQNDFEAIEASISRRKTNFVLPIAKRLHATNDDGRTNEARVEVALRRSAHATKAKMPFLGRMSGTPFNCIQFVKASGAIAQGG